MNTHNKKRKTDRRTLYTQNTIKQVLLSIMEGSEFNNISVTELCRNAEITRATFYLHYDNLSEVLNELIVEALRLSEHKQTESADRKPASACESIKENERMLPACQRIVDSPKYRVLFSDRSIAEYVTNYVYQHEKSAILPELINKYALDPSAAEMLFRFALNGSFAVNRSLNWEKNETWYSFQLLIARFIEGGMMAVSSKKYPDR